MLWLAEAEKHAMSPVNRYKNRLICHCLQVSEASIDAAAAKAPFQSIKEIAGRTGAGDGCTGCHRRLIQYLAEQR